MIGFVVRRVLQGLAVVFAMSLVVFVAIFALGNPIAMLVNPDSPPEVIARTAHQLGLDLPWYQQYARFIFHLLHGDFGTSYATSQPALGMILERFPATLELVITAIVVAALLGIPLGIYAGYRPRSLIAKCSNAISILLISLPSFWVALGLIIIFCIEMQWFPTGGRGKTASFLGWHTSLATVDGLRHLALPALNLALFPLALFIRLTRSGVEETMGLTFVKFARAKGLPMQRILWVYVLRNILVPITTVMGVVFGILLAFSVVTETIFSWPGSGRLMIDAIKTSDRPVIVAYLMFTVTLFVIINLLVDLGCALLDRRIAIDGER